MGTYNNWVGYWTKRLAVSQILVTSVLGAALTTGCQPPGSVEPAPSAVAQAPAPTVFVPRAIEPMTIEMTQLGDVSAVFMGPRPPATAAAPWIRIAKETAAAGLGRGERHYLFGTGVIAGRHSAAVCFWDESDPRIFCWPNDRPAWIELTKGRKVPTSILPGPDRGGIIRVYYKTNTGSITPALPPSGTLTPVAGKEWWYGGHSCPYWFWGADSFMYCWDPC